METSESNRTFNFSVGSLGNANYFSTGSPNYFSTGSLGNANYFSLGSLGNPNFSVGSLGNPNFSVGSLATTSFRLGSLGTPSFRGSSFQAGSFRIDSSSVYRSSCSGASDVFSRTSLSREGGLSDEEALTWAAIESHPNYNRIREHILSLAEDEFNEIDLENLGITERKILFDRSIEITEEEHEKFLWKLKNRLDQVGIDVPTIEVRFEHVSVEAEAHVGSRALTTVVNSVTNVLEGILGYLHIVTSKKVPISILHDVSGIIKPGRMTLLLGPPASGKTTLMLALAGKLDKDLKFSGSINYNGHGMDEFVPQRTAAYISQHDLHIGELTVRETFAFSARCQGVGSRYDMLTGPSKREKDEKIDPDPDLDAFFKAASQQGQEVSVATDYILKTLGLESCADTMVGDEMLRGISGGQRKRVTTGEMLVGPTRALFMDEISTGLDSSTTFQIVNSIKQSISILSGTALISLLQPAPETFELFDDIILLSEGQIVYQGPREHVPEFFESMGFKCPERKGIADFLQEVTSRKDQEQYWAYKDIPYKFIPVKEFVEAFRSFHVGQRLTDELATPFDKHKSHPSALTTNKFGVSKKEILKACFSRELLLMKRNSFAYIFKLIQLTIVAFFTMTLFLRTEMHKDSVEHGGIFMGALFFVVTTMTYNGIQELSMAVIKLPVFYKQRDLLFYPSWAYSLPSWILKIPVTLVEVAIWVLLTYYVIGFDPDVGSFFKQYLLLVCIGQMASALFRLISSLGRDMVVSSTFGSFVLIVFVILSGFILSRENIRKWWMWGYWISPLMYAQNAIVANEFLGRSWSRLLPNGETLGVAVLKSRGVFIESYWYWIGIVALTAYIFLFNGLFTVALAYLDPIRKPQPVLSEEALEDKHSSRIRKMIDSSSRGKIFAGDEISSKSPSMMSESNEVNQNKMRGLVLPFQPLSLAFDDIRYSVDMPQEMKARGFKEDRLLLLKGVSGTFRPGVLTALMGVSGAGKTTLMDVLSGRKTGGYIEGSIRISGYPKKQETFARVSGYCEQNDIHSPHITVYESLLYSAWLRLAPEINSSTRKMFIEEVIELVELDSLREALVGLPGVNGLSTEQRKRLTIAVEFVANPSIIFMDEPTSGLDARAAAIVMRAVRKIVDTGRTVVCTIHQPSIDIFEAFDELLSLKQGGEEIYVGPLGTHCCKLINHFEAIEGISRIKDGYNPATWMLEVTAPAQEAALGVNFNEIYRNSELYRRNKAMIEELSKPDPGSKDLYFPTQYSQSFFTQCLVCLWKQHWSYWRNPQYTGVRLFFTAFVGLLIGTIFWNLGTRTGRKQDFFNAMGAMFGAVTFLGIQNACSVQPLVFVERTVFYRERAAGMYSATAYAFAQILIEIPHIFIQTVIYGIMVYSMIAFEWTTVKFVWYLFFMYFSLLYYTFYGMMAVAMTPNPHISAILSSAFYSLWCLFSGVIIPRPSIPTWWRWYYWSCPVSWTLYGIVVSQFGDIQNKLESGETVVEFLRNYFGFRYDFLGVIAVVIVGFGVLFAFMFAFSIRTFNYHRR